MSILYALMKLSLRLEIFNRTTHVHFSSERRIFYSMQFHAVVAVESRNFEDIVQCPKYVRFVQSVLTLRIKQMFLQLNELALGLSKILFSTMAW